jgi:hypothetical protein
MIDIERIAMVTAPGGEVPYSPYGYVIQPDGTVYTLIHQYYHGIILACLYPKEAGAAGYAVPEEPREDLSVFKYQRFELDNSPALGAVRIAISQMIDSLFFSKGNKPATDEQCTAVAACLRALGKRARDKIETEKGERTISQILEELRVETDYEVTKSEPDGF